MKFSASLGKIKALLGENLGAKAISIAIAIILWFVVLGSQHVEVTKEVPIEIITSKDVVVTSEVPDRVQFRLAGPKAFLRTVLDRPEPPLRVNLSDAKAGLTTYRFFTDSIRVPLGVRVQAINPAAILVRLDPVKRVSIPIKIVMKGELAPGYRLFKAELNPPEALVFGPQTKMGDLKYVDTEPVDVTGLRSPLNRPVTLDLAPHGLRLEGDSPLLSLDIRPVNPNFRIKNVPISHNSTRRVSMMVKSVTVFVRADEDRLRGLDQKRIVAEIDLKGVAAGTYQRTVQVSLPKDVGLVRIVPETIDLIVH